LRLFTASAARCFGQHADHASADERPDHGVRRQPDPPNIHIDDITDLYLFLLDHPEHTGIYNAGFENISILDIANMVAKHVKAEIIVTPSNDPRSYRINSDRLLATGFRPKKNVEDAIKEIIGMYSQGRLKDEDRWYNLKWMEKDVVK
jgi:nucleoside-diphosphate-sugar epimerase